MLHYERNVLFLSFALLSFNTHTIHKKSVQIDTIEKMCGDLYLKMKKDNYKPDIIIGVARGGLIPLGYLVGEKMFNIRNTLSISVKSYESDKQGEISLLHPIHYEDLASYKNILVIDDIVDSGQTLCFVLDILKAHLSNVFIKTAVLYYKPKVATITPDYYVQETDDWIVFPWEQD